MALYISCYINSTNVYLKPTMCNALGANSGYPKVHKDECTSMCALKMPRKRNIACTELPVIGENNGIRYWRSRDKMCQDFRGGGNCCFN